MPNQPLQLPKCPHCGATHEGGRFCSVCGKAIPVPVVVHGAEAGTALQPVNLQEELATVEALLAEAGKREEELKSKLAELQLKRPPVFGQTPAVPGQDVESRIKAAEDKAKSFEAAFLAKSQELEKLAKELGSGGKAGGVKGWVIKSIAGVLIAGMSLGGGYKYGQYHPPAGSAAPKNEAAPLKPSPTPEPALVAKKEVVQPAPAPKHTTAKPVIHPKNPPKIAVQTFTLDLETKRDDTVVVVGAGKISSDDKKTKFTSGGPVPTGEYRVEGTNTSTRGPKVQIENPAKANGWLTKMTIHGKGKLTVALDWKPI